MKSSCESCRVAAVVLLLSPEKMLKNQEGWIYIWQSSSVKVDLFCCSSSPVIFLLFPCWTLVLSDNEVSVCAVIPVSQAPAALNTQCISVFSTLGPPCGHKEQIEALPTWSSKPLKRGSQSEETKRVEAKQLVSVSGGRTGPV